MLEQCCTRDILATCNNSGSRGFLQPFRRRIVCTMSETRELSKPRIQKLSLVLPLTIRNCVKNFFVPVAFLIENKFVFLRGRMFLILTAILCCENYYSPSWHLHNMRISLSTAGLHCFRLMAIAFPFLFGLDSLTQFSFSVLCYAREFTRNEIDNNQWK